MEHNIIMPAVSAKTKKGVVCLAQLEKGASVKKGDVIAEIETDKVVVAVESDHDGIFDKYIHGEGEEVAVGETIAVLKA